MAEPTTQQQDVQPILEPAKAAMLDQIVQLTATSGEDKASLTEAITALIQDIAKQGSPKEEKIDKDRVIGRYF
jgi:hypothetical protein